ncbi:MAG TPA: hypothetical protein VNQ77_06815 [Frankiaceae bacterium]|nr:hypothetical protein [Frankiaceae bacterium]
MRTRLLLVTLALAAGAAPAPATAEGGVWAPTLQATQAFDHLSAVGDGVYFAQYLDTYAKSTDSGATWLVQPKPPGQYYGLPGIRFATKGVGYSLSGGPGLESIVAGDLAFQEEVRRCGGIMPLQRTADGGKTWRAVCVPRSTLTSDPVFGPGAAPIGLANGGRTVMLAGSEHPRDHTKWPGCGKDRDVIYTSHDSGVRWTRAALPRGWYSGYRQYLLDKSTIVRLSYGGWKPVNETTCGSSTSGVFLSRDGGKSFKHIHTCAAPKVCTSVAMPTRNRIVLGRNDGSTVISWDGGKSWRPGQRLFDAARWQPVVDTGELPAEAFWVQSISFVDSKHGYASTRGSGTWRTTDGGLSWTQERSHECAWYLHGIGEIATGAPDSAITGGPHFISARTPVDGAPEGCAGPPPQVPRVSASDVVTTLPLDGSTLAIRADGGATATRSPKPGQSVSDPKGDWPLASADITSIRVGNAPGRTPRATVELALAAAPDPTTTYTAYVRGVADCDAWSFEVTRLGTPAPTGTWQRTGYCPGFQKPAVPPPPGLPAAVTVRGTTVTFTVPYADGLRRGLRLARVGSTTLSAPTGVCAGVGLLPVQCVMPGDQAGGAVSYVLR